MECYKRGFEPDKVFVVRNGVDKDIDKDIKVNGFLSNLEGRLNVSLKDKKILVTGISYVYSKRISLPALKELLVSAPETDLKILIVHQPSQMVIEIAAE